MNNKHPIELPKNYKDLTKSELNDIIDAHHRKHGHPLPSYDGEKNTIFGWTDDGKGVWILPASKSNFQRFEDIAASQPGLGQCELLELAGAEFFPDWRDSDRARRAMEVGPQAKGQAMDKYDGARGPPRPDCVERS